MNELATDLKILHEATLNNLKNSKASNTLRVTITPKHSAEDVQTFVTSLDKVWSKLGLKRAKKIASRVSKISNLF